MPVLEKISTIGIFWACSTVISTLLSSSFPSWSIFLNFSRVVSGNSWTVPGAGKGETAWLGAVGRGGRSRSRRRSSARSSAFFFTFRDSSFFTILTARSVRSRIIDSTSLPTYPTSVNLDASILRKGDWARWASRLAISVFPTPVGPIIMIFLGAISSRRGGSTCWRRHRFLKATATDRFASSWPITYWSSFLTISLGVSALADIILFPNCSGGAAKLE